MAFAAGVSVFLIAWWVAAVTNTPLERRARGEMEAPVVSLGRSFAKIVTRWAHTLWAGGVLA